MCLPVLPPLPEGVPERLPLSLSLSLGGGVLKRREPSALIRLDALLVSSIAIACTAMRPHAPPTQPNQQREWTLSETAILSTHTPHGVPALTRHTVTQSHSHTHTVTWPLHGSRFRVEINVNLGSW